MGDSAVVRYLKELRRRRVFRVAGLYVVAIWLLMQAADVLFPGWGIPEAAIRYLFWAGLAGFPVALVFGWVFDITAQGIRRTRPATAEAELRQALPLGLSDYLVLLAFLVAVGLIFIDTAGRVMQTATYDEWRPSPAEVEPNSVAVLPFANLSADSEQNYFADGISEEILNRLSAFRELKVIARTSSFAFKDSGYDIARISGLLAVNYLLQGSVRRDGQQLRIAAQLVDKNGVQLWSNSFDRELGRIFALQDEIAEAVATSIVPQIVPPQATNRQPDVEAYQHFLVGRELVRQRSLILHLRAIEQLDLAVKIDPEFAEAYAERGVARLLSAGPAGDEERATRVSRAAQDIDTALSLNPSLAPAVAAQAFLLIQQDFRSWGSGEDERILRWAIELDPNLVNARVWLQLTLHSQGRHMEAEEQLRQAARIDPLGPVVNVNLAVTEMGRGAFSTAETRLRRLLELPQPSALVYLGLFALLRDTGRLVEAMDVALHSPDAVGLKMMANAHLGLWEQAEAHQDRWEQENPGRLGIRLYRAWLEFHRGRFDQADAIVEQAGRAVHSGLLRSLSGLKALTGAHEDAIRILRARVERMHLRQGGCCPDLAQWLAWAYGQTGDLERARAILADVEAGFVARDADGWLHRGDQLYWFAVNAQQSGHGDAAIERLQRAVDAGWRKYFLALHDPRWDSMRDDPPFNALMETVKADVDAQRAEVERRYLEQEPGARLDAPGPRETVTGKAAEPERVHVSAETSFCQKPCLPRGARGVEVLDLQPDELIE